MCTSVTFCIQQNHDLPSQTKLGSIHVSFIFYYLCTFPTSLAWIIRAYHVYCYFLVPPKYFAFTKPIPKHLVLLTPGAHTVCCTGLFHFFFSMFDLSCQLCQPQHPKILLKRKKYAFCPSTLLHTYTHTYHSQADTFSDSFYFVTSVRILPVQ